MLSGERAQSHFRANEGRAESVARQREMTLGQSNLQSEQIILHSQFLDETGANLVGVD